MCVCVCLCVCVCVCVCVCAPARAPSSVYMHACVRRFPTSTRPPSPPRFFRNEHLRTVNRFPAIIHSDHLSYRQKEKLQQQTFKAFLTSFNKITISLPGQNKPQEALAVRKLHEPTIILITYQSLPIYTTLLVFRSLRVSRGHGSFHSRQGSRPPSRFTGSKGLAESGDGAAVCQAYPPCRNRVSAVRAINKKRKERLLFVRNSSLAGC